MTISQYLNILKTSSSHTNREMISDAQYRLMLYFNKLNQKNKEYIVILTISDFGNLIPSDSAATYMAAPQSPLGFLPVCI